MGVGRATVQSLYVEARKKLARFVVEASGLLIEGGNYEICSGETIGTNIKKEKGDCMAETTQVANQEPQTFSVALTEKLNSVAEALPKDFNKARFVQNALALVNDNPQLQKYSKAQLMSGLMKGAYLGLDFYSKECYLVPYGNQLNYQTDYRGAKKLAKKYSIRPIKDIYAKLVREGDDFEESIENGEQTFSFNPKAFNDGKIIGAFAVVLYKDGGMAYDTMTLADLENTRKSSKASNSPAWKNFTGEMYKKTVLHRLCKHIELDFENPTQQNAFLCWRRN